MAEPTLLQTDPEIARLIQQEEQRQHDKVRLKEDFGQGAEAGIVDSAGTFHSEHRHAECVGRFPHGVAAALGAHRRAANHQRSCRFTKMRNHVLRDLRRQRRGAKLTICFRDPRYPLIGNPLFEQIDGKADMHGAVTPCGRKFECLGDIRIQCGDRLRYVFRHRPITGSMLARRAAELAEHTKEPEKFWDAHVALMTRSPALSEEDLAAVSSAS